MKIHQLEQFEAIANSRTMREAADKLYLSQPALSQNLKKLESELGCTLFDRSHNQLKLTAYGEILLSHANRILFDLKEMQAEIDAQKERDAQKVRIGGFHAPLDVFVLPQIESAFPELSFAFERHPAKNLSRMLEDGLFDIIFVPKQYAHAHKASIEVCDESLLVSLPPSSSLAGRQELTAADLRALEFLIPQDLPGVTPWYEATLRSADVPEANIERLPSKAYLEAMDLTPKAHLSTSMMSLFASMSATRPSVPLAQLDSTRTIVASFDDENPKATEVATYIEKNKASLLASHAFLPFLLYHDTAVLH